ncbi:hypothetical protein [Rahnella perminowiae]|uniref:hypothetical protein n=1 Tax=Rahnella perminowiae TaxID=2816244 RepID=UPI0030B8AB63
MNVVDGRVPLGTMLEDPAFPILLKTEQQLNEYFAGERTRFELDLIFTGTEFRVKAPGGVAGNSFGETRSYGEIVSTHRSPESGSRRGCCQWS